MTHKPSLSTVRKEEEEKDKYKRSINTHLYTATKPPWTSLEIHKLELSRLL